MVTLDADMSSDRQNTSLVIVNGNPAVAYYADYNKIMYVRATDNTGSEWGEPTVACQDVAGYRPFLAVVNGKPAISFGDGVIMFIRAEDQNGDNWGTPSVVYDESGGYHSSIAIVNGNPAIVYDKPSGGIKYIRALDVNGDSWGTPIVLASDEISSSYKLILADNYPAIAYYIYVQKIYFKRASDINGETWNDGIQIGSSCYGATIANIGGYPAIAYRINTTPTLKFRQANDTGGDNWGQLFNISNTGDVFQNSMAEVNGHPAFIFSERTDPSPYYVLKFAIYK